MPRKLVLLASLTALSLGLLPNCQPSNRYRQGEQLYLSQCANCHMEDGQGLRGLIPPLAGADYVAADPLRMACIIRRGLADTIVVNGKTYQQKMPGNAVLNPVEIHNIINYINQAWGNNWGYTKMQEVEAALQKCPLD